MMLKEKKMQIYGVEIRKEIRRLQAERYFQMVTLSSRPGSVYGSRPTSPAVRSAGPTRGGAVPFTDLNSGV